MNRETLLRTAISEEDRLSSPLMLNGTVALHFRGGNNFCGSFQRGFFHGCGKYNWADGTRYEGQFKRNRAHGKGQYTWADGTTYNGDVMNGLRHGRGVLEHDGGSNGAYFRYEGEWKAGKRHGSGIMFYDREGQSKYEGSWRAGLKWGRGRELFRTGDEYDGQWRAGKRDGHGVMYWHKAGERYTGEWRMGMQHGQGEHVWMAPNTYNHHFQVINRYVGQFAYGKCHGHGTFFYSTGAKYDGEWVNNEKVGYCHYRHEDGTVLMGSARESRIQESSSTAQIEKVGLISFEDLIDYDDAYPSLEATARRLLLRHHQDLFAVFTMAKLSGKHALTLQQFWRLCQASKLAEATLPLAAIDALIDTDVTCLSQMGIHDPQRSLLFQPFMTALARIAVALFGVGKYPDPIKAIEDVIGRVRSLLCPVSPVFQHLPLTKESECLCRDLYDAHQQADKDRGMRVQLFLKILMDGEDAFRHIRLAKIINITLAHTIRHITRVPLVHACALEMVFVEFVDALEQAAKYVLRCRINCLREEKKQRRRRQFQLGNSTPKSADDASLDTENPEGQGSVDLSQHSSWIETEEEEEEEEDPTLDQEAEAFHTLIRNLWEATAAAAVASH